MIQRTAPPKSNDRPQDREKAARMAEALRANLARRKAQKRARTADPPPEEQGNQ